MELRSYIQIYRRRMWIIVLATLAAAVASFIIASRIDDKYRATATLRINYNMNNPIDYGMLEYMTRMRNTLAEIAVSGPVLSEFQEAGVDRSIGELKESISVEYPENNEILQVVVVDHDPAVAAQVADLLASSLISNNERAQTRRIFSLVPIEAAATPTAPIQPTRTTLIVLGIFGGLLAGVGLVALVENLDSTFQTPQQIEATSGLPTLGRIPRIHPARRKKLLNGTSPEGEAFRLLRTNCIAVGANTWPQTLLVVSAEPDSGKSTVAANLGYSLAQLGRKVVLIDADMRLSALHKVFQLPNDRGLSNLLRHEIELEAAIQQSSVPNIGVITAGPVPPNPAELLGSPRLATVIEELRGRFDAVIIDSPALLAVPDASIIAGISGSTLLVVRQAHSRHEALELAREQLDLVGARPLGVVVNCTEQSREYSKYQRR